jgi:hypothetical protein
VRFYWRLGACGGYFFFVPLWDSQVLQAYESPTPSQSLFLSFSQPPNADGLTTPCPRSCCPTMFRAIPVQIRPVPLHPLKQIMIPTEVQYLVQYQATTTHHQLHTSRVWSSLLRFLVSYTSEMPTTRSILIINHCPNTSSILENQSINQSLSSNIAR